MKTLALLSSLSLLACGSDAEPVDAGPDANLDGNYALTWTVNGGSMQAACTAVGASTVRVVAFEENASRGEIESFACNGFAGSSRGIPAGLYRFEIDLRSTDQRSLLAAPINVFDVDVTTGQESEVGAQAFTVTPTGSITFATTAENAADNCNDAGITGFRFNLRDAQGACVNTTFVAGADTYTSDCTENPAPLPCFESAQAVTVASTPSGPHMLEIRGIVDGITCRDHNANITVLGNDLDIDLGTRQTAEVACP